MARYTLQGLGGVVGVTCVSLHATGHRWCGMCDIVARYTLEGLGGVVGVTL